MLIPFMMCFVEEDDGGDEDDEAGSISSSTLSSTGWIAPESAEQLESCPRPVFSSHWCVVAAKLELGRP